ncbi:hypothetical protein [Botrimarina sp.]|uniref:hypothetical protein n=1 Tax=Botrimarina sp. TaxID=2795802 RepID=UPI0032F08CE2
MSHAPRPTPSGRPAAPPCACLVAALVLALAPGRCGAISIVLDFGLDEQNENWFDASTTDGRARRRAVGAAADLLSAIIVNDDWAPLSSLNESVTFTDIAASTIRGIDGSLLTGEPESDGQGYAYLDSTNNVDTVNRSGVDANEYVVYVGAFAFDSGTSSNAKGGWDSSDRRNSAGLARTEFNTWGGRVYFNTAKTWYAGQNPGADPTDDYGFQDPDKTPSGDRSDDNWDYSTSSDTWKGFQLSTRDPAAAGQRDLYATALHELLHALGATESVIEDYVGVDASGDFIGPNLVDAYGGPVPGDGGHFAVDVQSVVWGSDGIVSEALLDPNSLAGVRKYLTEVDAALLRDIGYQVATAFPSDLLQGDYNGDGRVDAADYVVWRDALGTDGQLANDPSFTEVNLDDYLAWADQYGLGGAPAPAPEPAGAPLLALAVLARLARRRDRRVL